MSKKFIYLIIALIITVTSCDNMEKIRKSTDGEYKLKMANEFFDKKKWENANILYEELITLNKGTARYEEIYYKYAYTFYNMKNYLAASYHFKNFTDIFPNSTKKDECDYQTCLCLYYMSPEETLEQASTIKAIGALQTYVNSNPDSKNIVAANKMIEEGRGKLETKDRTSAELYFKIGQFKGAAVSYSSLLKKYPDSDKADMYQLMIIKSYIEYANLSVTDKQEERYNMALVAYNDFLSNYPNSKLKSDVELLKNTIFAELQKIKK